MTVDRPKYLEQDAYEAIEDAVKHKSGVLMMIDGFRTDDEALCLRDMLWYARNRGVEVIFVPESSRVKVD